MSALSRTQAIAVSAGASEYTWALTITERAGEDISTSPVMLALGTESAPGGWRAPDTSRQGVTTAQRVVQLLVDEQTPAGTYYLWWELTDATETIVRLVPGYRLVVT